MKAIVTVVGEDKVGIIASVSAKLTEFNINILDISQTIMQDIFTMIMLVDIEKSTKNIEEISAEFKKLSEEIGVSITIQHNGIFRSMHRI